MPRLAIVRADEPDTIESLLPSSGLRLRAKANAWPKPSYTGNAG